MKRHRDSVSRPGLMSRLALVVLGLTLAVPQTACDPASSAAGDDDRNNENSEVSMTFTPPGATPYNDELQERLRAALTALGDDYEPRTHHLRDDGTPLYVNRLVFEDSPYLLQHAHNPVNWYPWGPDAFERARTEDKPIFLSIGYSTCHWCHVMERESFESEEIARILNENFVCIKIDRERRPDIDDLYMTAVQLLTQHGGWPMSSFLTVDGKPFFGGTYFQPAQFTQLLQQVDTMWRTNRDPLLEQADKLAAAVAEITAARGKAEKLSESAFGDTAAQIVGQHDSVHGGFRGAPKFPQEPWLLYLLDRVRRGDPAPTAAIVRSLDAMARGGIYDQVGGGFHRYSVDTEWLVPHFEKMLYNQAHQSRAYLEAYELDGNVFFGRVGRQILDYVMREMTAPGGGFYSATDADSEGEEGLFFLWTPDELKEVLGADDAAFVADLYGASAVGNFEHSNILNLPVGFKEYAAKNDTNVEALWKRLDSLREKLWQKRETRIHPIRDDKVLTAWNGMMITALAQGHATLGDARYLEAARTAATFLWEKNRRESGELWRVHLAGSSSIDAVQEDYAYYAEALLALHAETDDGVWLDRARQVTDAMVEHFHDAEDGGFFMSAAGGDPHLIARPKSPTDGAIPSGNSVAVRILAQLAARTGERRYGDLANETLNAFGGYLQRQPTGFAYMLTGAAELLHGAAGARAWGAEGNVRAAASLERKDGGYALRLDVTVADGWHVNGHEPLQENYVGTTLSAGEGWALNDVTYPEAENVTVAFEDKPLAVYHGKVTIGAQLTTAAKNETVVVPLRLQVQACDDEHCLRPEELVLEVPAGHLH